MCLHVLARMRLPPVLRPGCTGGGLYAAWGGGTNDLLLLLLLLRVRIELREILRWLRLRLLGISLLEARPLAILWGLCIA